MKRDNDMDKIPFEELRPHCSLAKVVERWFPTHHTYVIPMMPPNCDIRYFFHRVLVEKLGYSFSLLDLCYHHKSSEYPKIDRMLLLHEESFWKIVEPLLSKLE